MRQYVNAVPCFWIGREGLVITSVRFIFGWRINPHDRNDPFKAGSHSCNLIWFMMGGVCFCVSPNVHRPKSTSHEYLRARDELCGHSDCCWIRIIWITLVSYLNVLRRPYHTGTSAGARSVGAKIIGSIGGTRGRYMLLTSILTLIP